MRNIRLAVRMLLKTPFVSAVAVLSLALGIGANTAIFSMFEQILLKSLPVAAPTELVNLTIPGPIQGSDSCNQAGDCTEILSYPMFRDLEREQTALSGIAGHRLTEAAITIGEEPTVTDGVWVTGGYFSTLGIQPVAGRLLLAGDNEPGADNNVAVISHRLWTDRFGARPDALGQPLRINGVPYTIVGVTPAGFNGTTLPVRPDFYIPMQSRKWIGRYDGLADRRSYWVYVFGRLKPGVAPAAAKASLDGVVRPILAEVEAPLQVAMSEQTLARFKAKEVVLGAGRRGQSRIFDESRVPLLMLFAITGVVLMIACANIANLLLARGAGRAMEMGVRLALGATRRHDAQRLEGPFEAHDVLLGLAGVVSEGGLEHRGVRLLGELRQGLGELLLGIEHVAKLVDEQGIERVELHGGLLTADGGWEREEGRELQKAPGTVGCGPLAPSTPRTWSSSTRNGCRVRLGSFVLDIPAVPRFVRRVRGTSFGIRGSSTQPSDIGPVANPW